MSINEYPPPGYTPLGGVWTKDMNDTVIGFDGTTIYVKYKTTISGAAYGNGLYIAWSNSIYSYSHAAVYNPNEWPPSGAFDKVNGDSASKSGWHSSEGHNAVSAFSSTVDMTIPPNLYISLPNPISITSYSIQARPACCTTQVPTKWNFYGTNDGGVTWTLIHTQQNITGWTLGETRTFAVANSSDSTYHSFRWELLRNGIDTVMHISEVRLYGIEPTVPTSTTAFSRINYLLGNATNKTIRSQQIHSLFGSSVGPYPISAIRGIKPRLGNSPFNPAPSAQFLKTTYGYTGAGMYYIKPPFSDTVVQTLCLFDTFGGGWTCFMGGKHEHTYGLDAPSGGYSYDVKSFKNIFNSGFYLSGNPATTIVNATFSNFDVGNKYFLTKKEWYKNVSPGGIPEFLYFVTNDVNGTFDSHSSNNHAHLAPLTNADNFLVAGDFGNRAINTISYKVRGITSTSSRWWSYDAHSDVGYSGITSLLASEDSFGLSRVHTDHFASGQYMLRFIRERVGNSPYFPAPSAQYLKDTYNYTGTGVFFIKPAGTEITVKTLCLFDDFGGGWTCFMAGKFEHTYGLNTKTGTNYSIGDGNIFNSRYGLTADPLTQVLNAKFVDFDISNQYFLTKKDWHTRIHTTTTPEFLFYVTNDLSGAFDTHSSNNHAHVAPNSALENFFVSEFAPRAVTTPSCKVRGNYIGSSIGWWNGTNTFDPHIDVNYNGVTALISSEDAFGYGAIDAAHFQAGQYMLRFVRSARVGNCPSNPAPSAQYLKNTYGYTGTGYFYIKPVGSSITVRTLCLFDTFGGGWMCFIAGSYAQTYGVSGYAAPGPNIFASGVYFSADPLSQLSASASYTTEFNLRSRYFLTDDDWYKYLPKLAANREFLIYVTNSVDGVFDSHSNNNHAWMQPANTTGDFFQSNATNTPIYTPSCKARGLTFPTTISWWANDFHTDYGVNGVASVVSSEDAFGHSYPTSGHFTTGQYLLKFVR